MSPHSPYPLLASASRCVKGSVSRIQTRSVADLAPSANEFTKKKSLWSEDSHAESSTPGLAPNVHPRAEAITQKIFKRQANPYLEHTRTLRGHEMRLKSAITTGSSKGVVSKEKNNFLAVSGSESGPQEEDDLASFMDLTPGSFVEVRRNNVATLGIALGKVAHYRRIECMTMVASGELWSHRLQDVTFVVPSFVSSDLAQRCGTQEIPDNQNQLQARMETLKQLRSMIRTLETKYSHISKRQENLYSQFRSPRPDTWSETSVKEIVEMVEKTPEYPIVYATHRYLMDDSLHFVARDPYSISQMFDVRPKQEVEEIKKVVGWMRERDGPLKAFAARARPIIEANQTRIQETALSPPSKSKVPDIWTANDRVILSFLLRAVRPHRSMQKDPYYIGQSFIMRLLYPKLPEIRNHHVHDALVCLGVISPWQDLVVIQKSITSEPEPSTTSTRAVEEARLVDRVLASHSTPTKGPLGPEDLYHSDPLEAVRHDFGDLRAYVIDDADAKELDDAVSIERVPEEPGNYWLHSHIANPTADLPPTNVFAQRAMKQGSTLYLKHRTIPLFPSSLTHSTQSGWSLGSTLETGKPSRVLTFSAKVDEKGNILDYRVRAGLVKNLRVVSYDDVDKAIGTKPYAFTYPMGRVSQPQSFPGRTFSEDERQDLLLLDKLAKALQRSRYDNDGLTVFLHTATVKFGDFPRGSMTPNMTSRKFQGFPDFTEYSAYAGDIFERGAKGLVAENMKLASRVASRFALEHNIPMIRRAADPFGFVDAASKEKALAKRNAACGVVHHELFPLIESIPAGEYTMEPKQHAMLSIPAGEGYTRTTSPLRRSLDLVTHWQLHNALLGSKAPSHKPIFSREWMDQYRAAFFTAERNLKAMERVHNQFWQLMAIKKWQDGELRGFGGQPAPFPGSFEGFVGGDARLNALTGTCAQVMHIPELGIEGHLDAKKVPVGVPVRVKISEVQLGISPRLILALA